MKTRLLIIIGIIVIVSFSMTVVYFSSVFPPEETMVVGYCQDWCNADELTKLGCNAEVIDFIYRATNIFNENFDNDYFFLHWIGLPDSISQEKFDECLDIILEKRISIEPNPVFFEGYPQVNQNDRWCSTTWIAHHDTPINTQLIIEKILQKISEYGEKYDIAERKILIKSIDGNTSRISVQGVWNGTFENEEPFLTSFMKTFEFVSVEESIVACA